MGLRMRWQGWLVMWRHLGDQPSRALLGPRPRQHRNFPFGCDIWSVTLYPLCITYKQRLQSRWFALLPAQVAPAPPIADNQSFGCGKHAYSMMPRKEREGATSPGPVYMSSSQMSMQATSAFQRIFLTATSQPTIYKTFASTVLLAQQALGLRPHTSTPGPADRRIDSLTRPPYRRSRTQPSKTRVPKLMRRQRQQPPNPSHTSGQHPT